MSVRLFENNRWKNCDQSMQFRHHTAMNFIDQGEVLDIGCGDGLFLGLLKEKNISALGIDLSEEAVNKCVAKGLTAQLVDLENSKLPFADNQFEYSVLLDVLEHLYDPEDLLIEASRISRKVIISVPNFNSLRARYQVLFGNIPENNIPKKGHVYWFNYKVLTNMIQKNNLKIINIKTSTYKEKKYFIGFILKFLAKIFPNTFALSFVVEISK